MRMIEDLRCFRFTTTDDLLPNVGSDERWH